MERGKKKSQIDTNSLKLLYMSDLDKLMYLVGKLVEFSKEVNQWKQDDYIKLKAINEELEEVNERQSGIISELLSKGTQ